MLFNNNFWWNLISNYNNQFGLNSINKFFFFLRNNYKMLLIPKHFVYEEMSI